MDFEFESYKQLDMMFKTEIQTVLQKWISYKSIDPIEAALKKIDDLKSLKIYQSDFVWPLIRNSPPYLVPKNVENAEIINDILMKSMEVQASFHPGIPGCLGEQACFVVHGLLMTYFKAIPSIKNSIKRIIGLIDTTKGCAPHMYLKVGSYDIDNTNNSAWLTDQWFNEVRDRIMIDEDPGTTKRKSMENASNTDFSEGISRNKLRFVFGKDEKWEQKFAYECAYIDNFRYILYDKEMRNFIKEKYAIEIESLSKKWSRLCWNCFVENTDLKKCSKCRIALYCNRDCQDQDWKIHKVHHKMEENTKKRMGVNY